MSNKPEPIADILARVLPNLEPKNEITQALRDYMGKQKPRYKPPPSLPKPKPPDLTKPEPF